MIDIKTWNYLLSNHVQKFSRIRLIVFLFILPFTTPAQTGTIKDINGNNYKTIKIGEQIWMAENLHATNYNNGDPILFVENNDDWAATSSAAYCYYKNYKNNINKYGLLYNWFVVDDNREICPKGWHVPSDAEWKQLEKVLGMTTNETGKLTAWRGTDEGTKLKSLEYGGTNSFDFSALGTGYRQPSGSYKGLNTDNNYWTSTGYNNNGNREGILHGFLATKSTIVRNFHAPGYGFCIRCIQDKINSANLDQKKEN